jgi:hypothetical protein
MCLGMLRQDLVWEELTVLPRGPSQTSFYSPSEIFFKHGVALCYFVEPHSWFLLYSSIPQLGTAQLYPVLSVPSLLSCPAWPVQTVLSWFSYPGCPVCLDSPVSVILSGPSYPSCPVPAVQPTVISQSSCPRCIFFTFDVLSLYVYSLHIVPLRLAHWLYWILNFVGEMSF